MSVGTVVVVSSEIVTFVGAENVPGGIVNVARPSSLVTVPPVVGSMSAVGGARASVVEDEPVTGLVEGSGVVVVPVDVVASVVVPALVVSVVELETVVEVPPLESTVCVPV
jgi:hypothetical protein